MAGPRVVVVDNYDSFVYNLVQYLGELGADVLVIRNDASDLAGIEELAPDGIVISPGPGRPADAGVSNEVIRVLGRRTPVMGVCLGMQCMAEVFGGRIMRAPVLMHGKTSLVHHDGRGLFDGVPNPVRATRYHSLAVDPDSVPSDLEVTARSDDGTIMGLRHRQFPVEGVQFHPESVLTEAGHRMVANFLRSAAGSGPDGG
ncbi:MAG: glutamine amidotransferase [Acidimicrobiales bacterium]|nr:MAG: glutamine amidotransferase [Acidimicrobiales bacterium]